MISSCIMCNLVLFHPLYSVSQKISQYTEIRYFARNFRFFDPFLRGAHCPLGLEFWKILRYVCRDILLVFVYQVASNLDDIGGTTRQ